MATIWTVLVHCRHIQWNVISKKRIFVNIVTLGSGAFFRNSPKEGHIRNHGVEFYRSRCQTFPVAPMRHLINSFLACFCRCDVWSLHAIRAGNSIKMLPVLFAVEQDYLRVWSPLQMSRNSVFFLFWYFL